MKLLFIVLVIIFSSCTKNDISIVNREHTWINNNPDILDIVKSQFPINIIYPNENIVNNYKIIDNKLYKNNDNELKLAENYQPVLINTDNNYYYFLSIHDDDTIEQNGIFLFSGNGKLLNIFEINNNGKIIFSPDDKYISIVILRENIPWDDWVNNIMYIYTFPNYEELIGGNVYDGENIFWMENKIYYVSSNCVEEVNLDTKKFFIKCIIDNKLKTFHIIDLKDNKIYLKIESFNNFSDYKLIGINYRTINIK